MSRRQGDVGLEFRQVSAGDGNLKAHDLGLMSMGMGHGDEA